MPKGPQRAAAAAALTVHAKTRAEWRRWLAKHHETASAVTVVYARRGSGEPSITWDESVDEAICFGWIDGVRGRLDATHFTVRFTPRKPNSIWSKLNLERVKRLISADRMQPAGLRAFEHGKRKGRHEDAYATRDEVETPPELGAVLANRRYKKLFEAQSPSERKGWARWVAAATKAETRERRAREALLLIAAGRKPGETDNQAARRGVASKAEILGDATGQRSRKTSRR